MDDSATTCVAGITVTASLPPAAAPPRAVVFSGPLEAALQPTVQLLLCNGMVIADAARAGYPLPSLLTWQSSQVGQHVVARAAKMRSRAAVAVQDPHMSLLWHVPHSTDCLGRPSPQPEAMACMQHHASQICRAAGGAAAVTTCSITVRSATASPFLACHIVAYRLVGPKQQQQQQQQQLYCSVA